MQIMHIRNSFNWHNIAIGTLKQSSHSKFEGNRSKKILSLTAITVMMQTEKML